MTSANQLLTNLESGVYDELLMLPRISVSPPHMSLRVTIYRILNHNRVIGWRLVKSAERYGL